ncbi:MAG TPA: sensor histidine kinase [Levilinea sp.]|nr:sensor histidine kinase [Levilinea sp.]
MNLKTVIEPGMRQTFRLFIGVRLALVIFSLLVYLLAGDWEGLAPFWLFAFMLLDAGLLLVYLSLPRLEQMLKTAFLPLGIAWAAVGPLLQQHLVIDLLSGGMLDRSAFLLYLLPIFVLFIPLVIVSWRYSMRAVLLFCGLTFLMDGMLALWSVTTARPMIIFSPIMGMTFIRTVLFLLVGNMIVNLMKVQREQQRRLVEANQQLTRYAATLEQLTISRERNRMARELHDVLAHTMSGVAIELEGVRAMLRVDPNHAEKLLGQSLQAVREGLAETRRALQALRAAPVEDLGLNLAVRNLAETIASRAGLQTDLLIENDLGDYPVEALQCFYRVAQEALTNVVLHSQASRVQVSLGRVGPSLRLSVRDDGVGFDERTANPDQKYGLAGMRERAQMIRGELSIESQPGNGVHIQLTYRPDGRETSND